MLQAGGDAVLLPEEGQYLGRGGAGAQVPVVGDKAQQTVPDAAAHGVGRVAYCMETVQQICRTLVQWDENGFCSHEVSSSYCKMICLPSKPHSTGGKRAAAAGRASSGSVMMGE